MEKISYPFFESLSRRTLKSVKKFSKFSKNPWIDKELIPIFTDNKNTNINKFNFEF